MELEDSNNACSESLHSSIRQRVERLNWKFVGLWIQPNHFILYILTNCLCLQSPKKLPPPHLVPSLGSVLQNGNSNDSPSLPAPSLQLPILLWWWLWKMPSELQWLVTTTSILLHLPHACNSNIPRRN